MTINGKEIKIPEITFGTVTDLQEQKGIDLKTELAKVAQFNESAILNFVSLAFDGDKLKAAEAVGQYFAEGGDFTGLMEEINKAVEESGFFQAWLRTIDKMKETKKKK